MLAMYRHKLLVCIAVIPWRKGVFESKDPVSIIIVLGWLEAGDLYHQFTACQALDCCMAQMWELII